MSDRSPNNHVWILISISLLLVILSLSLFWFSEGLKKDTIEYLLITSLALSLGPLSIILILDRFLFTKSTEKILSEAFDEKFYIHTKLLSHGIYKVHDDLKFKDIFHNTLKGDIVEIIDTYIPDLESEFLSTFEKALLRGVNVRILFSKPGSNFANLRAFELGEKYIQTMSVEIIHCASEFLKTAIKIKDSNGAGTLELRFYESYASMPVYLVHQPNSISSVFFSFFLCDASRYSMHIELRKELSTNDDLMSSFHKYFDSKWYESSDNSIHNIADLENYHILPTSNS